ncbi:hypothetical protein [Daejeonella lutea]|uniref:HTH domain-containing protein n=1 Tax=Daejeonella lutea TaxID=572036 RepID=A0A1T5BYU8_9SPHI|nr:hypothetical protein [Daejeonella lutea]SKB52249.1 hypothetical protein SAMN05661099_1721 [Daejeonella lutea]
MKFIEQIERINRLHELIKFRRTGTPQELARRLDLSTSMVFKLLEELKVKEAPIEYSREFRTYYYTQPFLMNITLNFRPLSAEESID